MGDFNARTSTVSDLVAGDKCDRISPQRYVMYIWMRIYYVEIQKIKVAGYVVTGISF